MIEIETHTRLIIDAPSGQDNWLTIQDHGAPLLPMEFEAYNIEDW